MNLRLLPRSLMLTLCLGVVACADDGGENDNEGDMSQGKDSVAGDLGKGDGSDVITIGDSWMNLGNIGIQQSLKTVSGQPYRTYGVPGTKLLNEVIPNQYEAAKDENANIKTVIMTAGGNDVLQDLALLFGSCGDNQFDTTPGCKQRIDEVAARLGTLWAEMATDGVHDVIIVGYSNKTSPVGVVTGKSIAYSSMKIDPVCRMVPAPLRCTAIETDKDVPDLKIGPDGIHPDAPSYDLLAAQVWKVMQDKGMRR